MTKTKRFILITVLLAVALVSGVGAVYALSFGVRDAFVSRAATDTFAVGADALSADSYHFESASAETCSFTVVRKEFEGGLRPDKFDLLIYPFEVTVSNIDSAKTISGGFALYRNVAYTEGKTYTAAVSAPSEYKIAVVPADERNYYVSDAFGWKALSDEKLFNSDVLTPKDGLLQDYKNVYFTSDITADNELVLKSPMYLCLLYSTLTLNADVTLYNPYRGTYALEATPFAKVLGTGVFRVNAPLCFYETSSFASVLTDPTKLTFECNVDFAANTEAFNKLVSSAQNYAFAKLPDYLFRDVVLWRGYENYGITFGYDITAVSSGDTKSTLASNGSIVRKAESGVYSVKVTINYGGAAVGEITKTVTVAGTDDASVAEALCAYINRAVIKTGTDGKLNSGLSFSDVVNSFASDSGFTADFSVSLSGGTQYLVFSGDTQTSRQADFVYSSGKFSPSIGGIAVSGPVVLLKPLWVLEETSEIITVGINTASHNCTVPIKSVTEEEAKRYLDRFVPNVYFNTTESRADALYIKDGFIYYGGSTVPVIPSTLGYGVITYKMYLVDETVYDAIVTEADINAAALSGEEVTGEFTVADGILRPAANTALVVPQGKTLMMTVNFSSATKSYITASEIIIPTDGLSGNDYTEYIKGNTFKPYFDSLTDGKLIDSKAGAAGTAYKFTAEYGSSVYLEMTIENAEAVAAFCTLRETKAGTGDPDANKDYWQIDITVENIPAANTYVKLKAVFYTFTDSDNDGVTERNDISTQEYGFTVPGILKVGSEFDSADLYGFLVNYTVNGAPLFDSFQGYLLYDGIKAPAGILDFSGIFLGKVQTTPVSLKGTEYLTGADGFVFDKIELSNLSALSSCRFLKSLSMKNCNITSEMLYNADGGYLKGLNRLTELNLSGNAITSLTDNLGGALFYRALQRLDLSSQKDGQLTSLAGITELDFLTELNAENNGIANFNALKFLKSLNAVYLANNVSLVYTDGGVNFYGTDGQTNLTVYTELTVKGVKVFYRNENGNPVEFAVGEGITYDQMLAALALNALSYPYTHFGSVQVPLETVASADYVCSIKYVLTDERVRVDAAINGGTVSNLTSGIYRIIVSCSYKAETVYRELEIAVK